MLGELNFELANWFGMEQVSRRKGAQHSGTAVGDDYGKQRKTDMGKARLEYKYANMLMATFVPSLGIAASFGGRPAFIVICFGGIVAYIFDLIGTIEGTLLTFFVTGFAFWATMVWASRLLLQDSLWFGALVCIFGILFTYTFIVAASQFGNIFMELEWTFYFAETLIFATLPLISSALWAWFLCVEVPSFDLSLSFACCYFVNVLWLCSPRQSSHSIVLKLSGSYHDVRHKTFVLDLATMQLIYAMPLIICPCLHAAVAHNVLLSTPTHAMEFALSILWPLVMMLFCAQKQIKYWPAKEEAAVTGIIGTAFQVSCAALFCCLQAHPVFDGLFILIFAGCRRLQ